MKLIFLIVGCFLCWQNNLIRHNSMSSNPEATKEKVEFLTETQFLSATQQVLIIRSLSKHDN